MKLISLKSQSNLLRSILMMACLVLVIKGSKAQQVMGEPDIINFSHKTMGAGTQSWQIAQDRFGVMYLANNSGLVTYNGKEWKMFKLPNKTIIRTLYLAPDDKIYVGGQGEFGYFFPGLNGHLEYHSLTAAIPESERSFGDVWKITRFGSLIYFRTYRKIYQFDPQNKKVRTFSTPHLAKWDFLGVCNQSLFARNEELGLVVFKNSRWTPLEGTPFKDMEITGMLEFGSDSICITTLRHGVFIMHQGQVQPMALSPRIKSAQIYTAYPVQPGVFALGTVSGGVFFIDKSGAIIRQFSIENGMQNNNVHALFIDQHKGLWVGLDEGVDLIDFDAAVQLIKPVQKMPIAAYTATFFKDHLYIGTSDGVYQGRLSVPYTGDYSLSRQDFSKVQQVAGQTWSLNVIQDQLLAGMHDGAFIIHQNQARLLNEADGGTWLFRSVIPGNKIISGTYSGLSAFDAMPGLKAAKFSNLLKESLRFIEYDSVNRTIWASHPYRGIYKISLATDLAGETGYRLLTTQDGLPSNNNNFVFKVNHKIVFATEQGIYEWDTQQKRFVPSTRYASIFGALSVKFMTSDSQQRIWFATEKRVGVVEKDQKIRYFPELDGMLIAGFENINPINDQNILIGSSKGIFHLNYMRYRRKSSQFSVLLNKVEAIGAWDSLLYNGYFRIQDSMARMQEPGVFIQLPAQFNAYHFEFATNNYLNPTKMEYSFKLEGFDKDWSPWSLKSDKDYTNLSHGKYHFWVRAKGPQGQLTTAIKYSFEVLPRWYQTRVAYLVYTLFLFYVFFLLNKLHLLRLRRQQEKYEREQEQLTYIHDLEIDRSEKQIIELQKEWLETEVRYKNKELATTTMHLYKRGRLLGKIKEEVTNGIKKISNKEEKSDFNKLLKLITEEEKRDNDWQQFSMHFDQVHNNFLNNIKVAYPALTASDLKICAYVKMNLSSKEMAQLLNITLKGVEIARYRLRKKLELPTDVQLSGFIQEFS